MPVPNPTVRSNVKSNVLCLPPPLGGDPLPHPLERIRGAQKVGVVIVGDEVLLGKVILWIFWGGVYNVRLSFVCACVCVSVCMCSCS